MSFRIYLYTYMKRKYTRNLFKYDLRNKKHCIGVERFCCSRPSGTHPIIGGYTVERLGSNSNSFYRCHSISKKSKRRFCIYRCLDLITEPQTATEYVDTLLRFSESNSISSPRKMLKFTSSKNKILIFSINAIYFAILHKKSPRKIQDSRGKHEMRVGSNGHGEWQEHFWLSVKRYLLL